MFLWISVDNFPPDRRLALYQPLLAHRPSKGESNRGACAASGIFEASSLFGVFLPFHEVLGMRLESPRSMQDAGITARSFRSAFVFLRA